jgi:hypothetical protein
MAVRRGGARFAMVIALAAGLVAIGSAPAAAADDNVGIRLPTRFTAGGAPGSITVSVSKRTDGCVSVRTALGMRLSGLSPEQVRVQVNTGDEWRRIGVTAAGDGFVVTERSVPDKAVICKRRSTYVRYRLAFLDGAPSGRVTVVAEAYSAGGGLIDRAAGTRSVVGGTSASPSPSATDSAAPAVGQAPSAGESSVDLAAPGGRPAESSGSGVGLSTLVMLFGLALVGLGGALLVLLLRRNRAGPDEPGDYAFPGSGPPPPPPLGDSDATLILPKAPPY